MSNLINSELLNAKKEALDLFSDTAAKVETFCGWLLDRKVSIMHIINEVDNIEVVGMELVLFNKSELRDFSLNHYILIKKITSFLVSLDGFISEGESTEQDLEHFGRIKGDTDTLKAIKEVEKIIKLYKLQ